MRKILTNDRSNLERTKARTSDEKRKKRSFLEKRSKEISTRRRGIQIMSWLFRDNVYEDFTTKPAFSLKKLSFFAHQGTFCHLTLFFTLSCWRYLRTNGKQKFLRPKYPLKNAKNFDKTSMKSTSQKKNCPKSANSRHFVWIFQKKSIPLHRFSKEKRHGDCSSVG